MKKISSHEVFETRKWTSRSKWQLERKESKPGIFEKVELRRFECEGQGRVRDIKWFGVTGRAVLFKVRADRMMEVFWGQDAGLIWGCSAFKVLVGIQKWGPIVWHKGWQEISWNHPHANNIWRHEVGYFVHGQEKVCGQSISEFLPLGRGGQEKDSERERTHSQKWQNPDFGSILCYPYCYQGDFSRTQI